LNPIKIFGGSFGGPTLYENPFYISPNQVFIDVPCWPSVFEPFSFLNFYKFFLFVVHYSSHFGASRFEHWRKGKRLGSMQRKSKQRQGGRCMSYQIHWSLMSLQICGKNDTFEDLVLFGYKEHNFLSSSFQLEMAEFA
jgi:hypothetical protein